MCACVKIFEKMWGCTSVRIVSSDGSPVYGRTLDYSVPFQSEIRVVVPGTRFQGTSYYGPDRRGKTWRSVYKYRGLNTTVLPELSGWVVDGINEKGLVASALYLPNYSRYEDPCLERVDETVGCWEVVDLLLGTCASIHEARKRLGSVVVAEQGFPVVVDWIAPQIHFHVVDADGNDLVVEYIDGQCKMYDNPEGVLTNEPPFDQQRRNLERYAGLTPRFDTSSPLRQNGNGFLGLPGDYTSVSRFVRASVLRRFMTTPRDAAEGERLMWRIMGNFDIVPGIERTRENRINETQWTVVYDLRKKKMSVRFPTEIVPQSFFV